MACLWLLFGKKTLQPFAHLRSNSSMQTGDLAKAARPRPCWARLTKRGIIAMLHNQYQHSLHSFNVI
jgi:hypothetical protein